MKKKTRTWFDIFLNLSLTVAIIGVTYSWMLTEPSVAEIVNYNRQLIITTSDVTAKLYAYINSEYVEQTTSPIYLGLLEPGAYQRYRLDITNNSSSLASTKIVFTDITGDIETIKDHLIFGSTSPKVFSYPMATNLKQNTYDSTYYVDFVEDIKIPGNDTVSLYWYVTVSTAATSEIGDSGIEINSIAFIKP